MSHPRLKTLLALTIGSLFLVVLSNGIEGQEKKAKKKADPKAQAKAPARPQFSTPVDQIKVAKDFKVERLYSVPKEKEGSWVNLCVDPKGRLITSDQYGPLYRITLPPLGATEPFKVERIPADVGDAQGLLWAFDALYVMSNSNRKTPGGTQLRPALYRVTSSKNDDTLDRVEMLLEFQGAGGEHGTHAILPHPDGKRLTLVCGNQTRMPKYDTTRVPPVWGDDHLLPRMPDGNGFMRGVMGPGGFICNVDPNGKNMELVSVGFRNEFDAGYNANGDLFSYDADMEWDMNTPWYRPTRVCHVVTGSEFGWRNGAGKYPAYYPDNLPGIVNIGPGSPTGTCFGYGAKFPVKYQNAYFICDWSYGKLYAVHTKPSNGGYTAEAEEFISGTPLALTDVVVNPKDGALYFAVGGRQTQSGLYRVTYTGSESTAPNVIVHNDKEIKERKKLESLIGKKDASAIPAALKGLASDDRNTRFLARTFLEFQDPQGWAEQVMNLGDDRARIHGLLGLIRVSAVCPQHTKESSPKADPALAAKILDKLNAVDLSKLSSEATVDLIRCYHILFHRFGAPTDAQKSAVLAKWEGRFPSADRWENADLGQLLVYLESPSIAKKMVKLMLDAPTQEEQMEYMRSLRVLKTGWTPELRKDYFNMFVKAASFRGGNSLRGFMRLMREDAWASVPEAERAALRPIIDAIPSGPVVDLGPSRPLLKKYTLDELAAKLDSGLKSGRNFERGRKMFAEARCFGCHRYDTDGSSFGPDLTSIAGRFNSKDLLESIVNPNKEISDQYAAVEIETYSGKKVVGRIVNLNGDNININTNMLDPNKMESVRVSDIETRKLSKVSMMPEGLLDVLKEDEILDLMAYLLSRGDRKSPMFK